jgi:hypothetical protein
VTWQIPVFATGARTVDVRDVIVAALLRGERDAAIAAARAPADGDVQALCDAWRYERDLITAEETERWLEARGVTLEEFDEFILRQSNSSDETVALMDTDPEAREKLRVHGVTPFGRIRPARVVPELALRGVARGSPLSRAKKTGVRRGFLRSGAAMSTGSKCSRVEAAWHQEVAALLTPAALAQTLATLRRLHATGISRPRSRVA